MSSQETIKVGIEVTAEGAAAFDQIIDKTKVLEEGMKKYGVSATDLNKRALELALVHSKLATDLGSADAATFKMAGDVNRLSAEMQGLGVKGPLAFERLATSSATLNKQQIVIGQRFEDIGKSAAASAIGMATAEKGTVSLASAATAGYGAFNQFDDALAKAKKDGTTTGEALGGVAAGGVAAFVAAFAVPKIIEAVSAIGELRKESLLLQESQMNASAYNTKQAQQYEEIARVAGLTTDKLREMGITGFAQLVEHAKSNPAGKIGQAYQQLIKHVHDLEMGTKSAALASYEHSQNMRIQAGLAQQAFEYNKKQEHGNKVQAELTRLTKDYNVSLGDLKATSEALVMQQGVLREKGDELITQRHKGIITDEQLREGQIKLKMATGDLQKETSSLVGQYTELGFKTYELPNGLRLIFEEFNRNTKATDENKKAVADLAAEYRKFDEERAENNRKHWEDYRKEKEKNEGGDGGGGGGGKDKSPWEGKGGTPQGIADALNQRKETKSISNEQFGGDPAQLAAAVKALRQMSKGSAANEWLTMAANELQGGNLGGAKGVLESLQTQANSLNLSGGAQYGLQLRGGIFGLQQLLGGLENSGPSMPSGPTPSPGRSGGGAGGFGAAELREIAAGTAANAAGLKDLARAITGFAQRPIELHVDGREMAASVNEKNARGEARRV